MAVTKDIKIFTWCRCLNFKLWV